MEIRIAENIKKFRGARGFTQADLAVLLSVSTQAVNRWENGKAFPDITLLPELAKYLDVSIDELMGNGGRQNKGLERELRERRQMIIDDESEKIQNQLRICDLYEELAKTDSFYRRDYFQYLMCAKKQGDFEPNLLEGRILRARQMLRDDLGRSGLCERVELLNTIAIHEDEDKLADWADEYEMPPYIRASFWDELLLARYVCNKSADKLNAQHRKILFDRIQDTIYYLTECDVCDGKEPEACDLQRYRTALDMLALYSKRSDDVFIFARIMAEVRLAEALFSNGRTEESLDLFSQATEHLELLHRLPENSELCGSVPLLDTIRMRVSRSDIFEKCIMNIGGYDRNPLYDRVRADGRFVAYREALHRFLPRNACRSWINEQGDDALDARWEMLLNRARKEAEELDDGVVVVLLTAGGAVDSMVFEDLSSAIEAEDALKFLLEKKKNGDARIERLICMWHDGGVDIPSFAFREALLTIERANGHAQVLMNGLNGYIVKTVKATMPAGYRV